MTVVKIILAVLAVPFGLWTFWRLGFRYCNCTMPFPFGNIFESEAPMEEPFPFLTFAVTAALIILAAAL